MSINQEIEVALRFRLASAEAMLRKTLETYAALTTEAFSEGEDREIREEIARFLGLDPSAYCLWVTADPPSARKRSRQGREIQRRHAKAGYTPA